MIRILFDQNFNGKILRGLKERIPELDCVTTHEIGIEAYSDPQLLSWAATENRVILTHDAKTFPIFAYERMTKGEKMSGVIVVSDQMAIGRAIDDLELIILGRFENKWENNVTRIPL
jgi:predicted nuclease of predicted toxin-antitoxin system